tara:strand:+ start:430 stop:690 length:261 start_codon:yes stop_codon:yes gene_type:complete
MASEQETKQQETILINGEEHNISDLTPQQTAFITHITDLDAKARQVNYNLEQTLAARAHFMSLLNASIEEKPAAEAEKPAEEESSS